MSLRKLVLLALLTVVAGLVAPLRGATFEASGHEPRPLHGDCSPCSDPDAGGHACGAGCPCACCRAPLPGAAFAPAPGVAELPRLLGLLPAGTPKFRPRDSLRPLEVRFRIFHPPRV